MKIKLMVSCRSSHEYSIFKKSLACTLRTPPTAMPTRPSSKAWKRCPEMVGLTNKNWNRIMASGLLFDQQTRMVYSCLINTRRYSKQKYELKITKKT